MDAECTGRLRMRRITGSIHVQQLENEDVGFRSPSDCILYNFNAVAVLPGHRC